MQDEYPQIFKYKDWQIQFENDGYIILDGISKENLEVLKNETKVFIKDVKDFFPKRYFPVGQLNDFSIRRKSTAIIEQHLSPLLKQHFIPDAVDIYSGTHLIKPIGKISFLSTHQDSTLVDETKHNAIIAWCPLQDINLLNGRLCVLKGSHKYKNHYRSTTIPWIFEPYKKKFIRTPLLLPLKQVRYVIFT